MKISKIILLGVSSALTIGGAVVEISRADKITAGKGNKDSLAFNSIQELKAITDTIPEASVYQLLSSKDEEARNLFDLGENFHSLTLRNQLNRNYTIDTDTKKVSDVGESFVEPSLEGKLFNETEFDPSHTEWKNYPYSYTIKELWAEQKLTETYNNDITSYYTENGLMLDFKIDHTLCYEDEFYLYNCPIFAGADESYLKDARSIANHYVEKSNLQTLLNGAIYITDGTAYLKYDKYENNYSFKDVSTTDMKKGSYIETPKEFNENFYAHFPEARPSETKQIKDSMEKAIKKYYGRFFDLRFTYEEKSLEEIMKNLPQTEEEMKKLSDKEIKKMMSDVAMVMITPALASMCDSTISEMIDVGNIPMSQLRYNLDFYGESDEDNNLVNVEKEGARYPLKDNHLDDYIVGYNANSNYLSASEYERLNQEYILNQVESMINNYFNTLISDVKNNADEETKRAVEECLELIDYYENVEDYEQRNLVKQRLDGILAAFAIDYYDFKLNPKYDNDGTAMLTFVDKTAPTFYTEYRAIDYMDLLKQRHNASYKDTYTITNVDNTVIHAPKKINLNVYDVYKGAMDEFASIQYDEYKKALGE